MPLLYHDAAKFVVLSVRPQLQPPRTTFPSGQLKAARSHLRARTGAKAYSAGSIIQLYVSTQIFKKAYNMKKYIERDQLLETKKKHDGNISTYSEIVLQK